MKTSIDSPAFAKRYVEEAGSAAVEQLCCEASELAKSTTVNLVPPVIAEAIGVLKNSPVQAMDALHVACALQRNAGLFVSSVERQLSAARHTKGG
jgi:uncharacterized protein